VAYLGHFFAQYPRVLPAHLVQSDTRMQDSPVSQSRFSLQSVRLVGHLTRLGCCTHCGPLSGSLGSAHMQSSLRCPHWPGTAPLQRVLVCPSHTSLNASVPNWAEASSSARPPKTVARAPPARRRSASRREGFAATRAFVSSSNRRLSMNASLQIPMRGSETSALKSHLEMARPIGQARARSAGPPHFKAPEEAKLRDLSAL
jgi:hypothetical protein